MPKRVKKHKLKIHPEYYYAVDAGNKLFEIRKDDRGFEVGDILILQEYDPDQDKYTGNELEVTVTYITNFAQKEGYVVMGIKVFRTSRR